MDAVGVRAGIVERLGLDCPPDEVDAAWMAAFMEDGAVLAVLEALDPSVRVGLLSNNDALVGSLIETYLPGVAARCDAVVVSGVTGVRKPSERAYAAGLAALGASAAGCVFVDDSPSNVEGGRAAGIDSVLHTDPVQLARDLAERGVVTG